MYTYFEETSEVTDMMKLKVLCYRGHILQHFCSSNGPVGFEKAFKSPSLCEGHSKVSGCGSHVSCDGFVHAQLLQKQELKVVLRTKVPGSPCGGE